MMNLNFALCFGAAFNFVLTRTGGLKISSVEGVKKLLFATASLGQKVSSNYLIVVFHEKIYKERPL